MRLRVLVEPRHGGSYEQILAMAKATEEAGFDAFFRSDHLFGVDPRDSTYRPTDSWTTLAGLARDTRRIRLGTLLTAGTFRAPGVLATTVASADEMSGGRVELGLGAAWYEREHAAFGLDFPSLGERFDRLEEQLAIITGLWETPPGERFDFAGKHYRLDACDVLPRTAQSPRPPIIIGGSGPRRTPALAARFADEFNLTFPNGMRDRLENFERICEKLGRDPATVRKSVVLPVACGTSQTEAESRASVIGSPFLRGEAVVGRPDAVAEKVAALRDEGVDTLYFHIYDIDDVDQIRLLGADVLSGF